MSLVRNAPSLPLSGGLMLMVTAVFAAGLVLGSLLSADRAIRPAPVSAARPVLSNGYPVEVIRVLDGDTFEARVRVWPGMEAVTRVRLRHIDAPEMKARCDDEYAKAVAARDTLSRMLHADGVRIHNVGQDKYGGRVDADASSVETPDIGEAMVVLGLARRYDGGRRAGWCG
jgi:endonuclease YncB( thermonuclease family)